MMNKVFSDVNKMLGFTAAFCLSTLSAFATATVDESEPHCQKVWSVLLSMEPSEASLDRTIEAVLKEINAHDEIEERVIMVEWLTERVGSIMANDLEATEKPPQELFFAFTMAKLNFELLEFEVEDGAVVNWEYLWWRLIGGVAPRTDVPTIDDISHSPYTIYALKLLSAVSGVPDPILTAPNGRPVYEK